MGRRLAAVRRSCTVINTVTNPNAAVAVIDLPQCFSIITVCNVQEKEARSLYMWEMTRRKRNVSYRHITIENVCELNFFSWPVRRGPSRIAPSTTEACVAICGAFL